MLGSPLDVVDGEGHLQHGVGVRLAVLQVHEVGELGQATRQLALPRAQVGAPSLPALSLPPQRGLAGAGDGRLHLLRAGDGLARFQSVETHPDFRGRGLAGTLVHRVSGYGFGELGARTLVMVADPDYLAVRIYRSVGFADTEVQTQLQQTRR